MNQHNTTKTQHHHIKKDSFRDKIYIKFLLHHFTSASNKDSVSQKKCAGEVFSIDWLITFFTEKNKEKRTTKELKKTNNNTQTTDRRNNPDSEIDHTTNRTNNQFETNTTDQNQFDCSNWTPEQLDSPIAAINCIYRIELHFFIIQYAGPYLRDHLICLGDRKGG